MKRKRQVRRITLPHPPRRSATGGSMPSICIECGEPIDLGAVNLAIGTNATYRHTCGRVLVREQVS